jgi:hypothetical protein
MAKAAKRLVICVDNSGYEVSLERRKIYVSIPDAKAESLGHVRVIDESGEDYLYPKRPLSKSPCRGQFAELSRTQPNWRLDRARRQAAVTSGEASR